MTHSRSNNLPKKESRNPFLGMRGGTLKMIFVWDACVIMMIPLITEWLTYNTKRKAARRFEKKTIPRLLLNPKHCFRKYFMLSISLEFDLRLNVQPSMPVK